MSEAKRSLDCQIAEKLFGYKWYAFSKAERDDPSGQRTERIVRTLIDPKSAKDHWGEHRLATGDEPIERADSTTAIMRLSIPDYSASWEGAGAVFAKLPWQWKLDYDPGGWGVFEIFIADDTEGGQRYRHKFNHPDGAPEAICVAVLKAINAGHKAR